MVPIIHNLLIANSTNHPRSVNSIFNPSFVDNLFSRPASNRQALIDDARATNYGVVRLGLIEKLYERMYDQLRELGRDERRWPHRIRAATDVVGFEPSSPESVRLRIRPLAAEPNSSNDEILDVDLVIAATGYRRNAHLTLMRDVEALLPNATEGEEQRGGSDAKMTSGDAATTCVPADSRIGDRPVRVGRNYGVQFAAGKVAPGSGIWLQGCCEGTHGVSPPSSNDSHLYLFSEHYSNIHLQLSDTLLSILSVRSGEIVDSVFGTQGR